MIGLGGGFKTSTQNRENSLSMVIYADIYSKWTKNASFSFISQPILIVIALFGRAELRTLNFYTEFCKFCSID